MGEITAILGTHDQQTLDQLMGVAKEAEYVALMGDGHFGYWAPVGSVAAFAGRVSATGVGYDIACGNCAIATDLTLKDWSRESLELLADEIQSTISFGVGRNNLASDAPVDHPLFQGDAWSLLPKDQRQRLFQIAQNQIGTVGAGNHYVDVFVDHDGYLWVGVHFGSRGFGWNIAAGFMAASINEPWGTRLDGLGDRIGGALLPLDQPIGQDYFALMELAGKYAYAGREWVARKVVNLLGGEVKDGNIVHNHHNFAWKERHFNQDLVVTRKGATPAWEGQYGFVGGSMGDISVILQGADPTFMPVNTGSFQDSLMHSTVHGAGRVMGRMQAKGKVKIAKSWRCDNRNCSAEGYEVMADSVRGNQHPRCPICQGALTRHRKETVVREPRVTKDMMDSALKGMGVILRGGDVDEAPQVYRKLIDVLAEQGNSIEVRHVLKPLVVVMAGSDEHDPYKD